MNMIFEIYFQNHLRKCEFKLFFILGGLLRKILPFHIVFVFKKFFVQVLIHKSSAAMSIHVTEFLYELATLLLLAKDQFQVGYDEQLFARETYHKISHLG
jgi:hypothetical protein